MKRREKLWVVRAGDGATVGDIVRRAREDAAAVSEGRVFVGRRRATRGSDPVKPGDEVRIAERERGADDVPILFQEDDLVAVAKPAGIPTVPDHRGGAHALVAVVARMLGRGPADLRITSRLDREVSGAVVFALSAEAEARLRGARERGEYARRYVALAATRSEEAGAVHRFAAPIAGKPSETCARVVALAPRAPVAMLAVDPQTGRTHQIRIHASGAGMPLLGDREYGGPAKLTLASGAVLSLARIALHAARVMVPGRGRMLVARAPIPAELLRMWTELGGEPEAWNTGETCACSDREPPSSSS